ncbi:MAG TPA: N-6 DNA methylase [Pyrinomonadaceae bacterium]|nr:N-6 DNA methylase [Pyrinomonadaceae bacterium]
MKSKATVYKRVMESAGFYHDGEPIPTLVEVEELKDGDQVEKYLRYNTIVSSDKTKTTSIYELSGSPCIYFANLEQADPSSAELSEIRKAAWNQGLAPMLWVITPAKILIYNCYAKPALEDDYDSSRHLLRLFEYTEEGLRKLNEFAGRLEIESGRFWQQEEAKQIDRRERVDAALLRDLAEAERQLIAGGLDRHIAHTLLGRSIFIAYLQDRGILKPQFFRSRFGVADFTELLGSKTATYDLFKWVRRTFNGDLFPLTYKKRSRKNKRGRTLREQDFVTSDHLRVIRRLMSGAEVSTGQGRLWPYDFSIIPVELISSIYENFAYAGDPTAARARSTHYTPIHLVDLVLTQVFDGLPADTKVLDMACGSGVFLVESLRRLVARRTLGGAERTRQLIRDTLYNQIYGIDISKEAVQLAAFSLYLTALELDPKPQPPSALKFKKLIGKNLFAADAFNEKAPFNRVEPFVNREFGAVVGNPPWKSGKKSDHELLLNYCKERECPLARNTPDQAFMWRAADFAADHARVGLILHSKPFFAHTPSAQKAKKALLTKFKPLVLVNLSDLRQDRLFPYAVAPALVLVAECRNSKKGESFVYVSPQRSEAFKQHGIIEIGSENIKTLPVSGAANDLDMLKVASWGGPRDFELVRSLRNSFPTLEDFINSNGCNAGQGFQKAGGSTAAPELYRIKHLPPGMMPPYQINLRALEPLTPQGLHRPRDVRIYKGPLVITTRGLSGGFASSFSNEDVVYSESYYGISFPRSRVRWAHYLNAILNSSLATYFLFMTSTVWGVERDEVRAEDILRLPIPIEAEESLPGIIDLETQLRHSDEGSNRERLERQLDEAIFNLYGLDDNERVLVQDTVNLTIDLRMKKQASKAVTQPSLSQMKAYIAHVVEVIQPFLQQLDGQNIAADVLDVGGAPLRVVRFSMNQANGMTSSPGVVPYKELESVLQEIAKQLPHRIADKIYTQRVLRIYAGNALYIVKPAQRRYWSRSAGLSDADAILAEHLDDEDRDYIDQPAAGWPSSPTQAVHTA